MRLKAAETGVWFEWALNLLPSTLSIGVSFRVELVHAGVAR